MDEMPDLTQARRVLAGDRAAFDGLFDRYADRVYRLARRRASDEQEARRLTQQMLDRAFRNLSAYRGGMPLDVWVLVQCKAVLAGAVPSAPQPRQAWDSPAMP
jgi:RNA polymerase sigma-70 factor (ECF subfamily)